MTVSLAGIARQLQVLQDIEAIKRLKHAYFRCVDTANLAELEGLVHPDVTTCYVGGSYRIELGNRAEFLDMVADGSPDDHSAGRGTSSASLQRITIAYAKRRHASSTSIVRR